MGLEHAVAAEVDLAALTRADRRDQAASPARCTRAPRQPGGAPHRRAPARLLGPHEVVVDHRRGRATIAADADPARHRAAAPGSPTGRTPDGDRVLTTRDCLPAASAARAPRRRSAPGSPASSSCTCSPRFGSPGDAHRQPPAGAAAARTPRWPRRSRTTSSSRGVHLLKGARADGDRARRDDGRRVRCDDGRVVRRAATRCWPSAPIPNSDGLGLEAAGVVSRRRGYVTINRHCQLNVAHIYAAGDVSGKLPLSSVAADAGPQDRRARDGAAHGRPPPPRLRQGGVGHLHRARDRRRRPGRGRGVRRGPQDPGDQGAVLGRRPRR